MNLDGLKSEVTIKTEEPSEEKSNARRGGKPNQKKSKHKSFFLTF